MDFARGKRKGGGGYKVTKRDQKAFCQSTVRKLDALEQHHNSDKQRYGKYIDPNLIFKINLTQNVSDDNFRSELSRAGLQTLSSTSSKDGYLVVFASDAHLVQFRKKLESRVPKDKATFVDAIDNIEEIPQEEKLGESLQKRSLQGLEIEYIDVEIWRMETGG